MLNQSNNSGAATQRPPTFAELRAAAAAVKIPNQTDTPTSNAHSETSPSDLAISFLKAFDPDGRHNLVAIDPHKMMRLEARTFAAGAWTEMAAWVDAREGRRNLYFAVNEPKIDAPNDKLGKREIASIRALHVDIDPTDPPGGDTESRKAHTETERNRLQALVMALGSDGAPPSIAIDSGNGVYPIWKLQQKLDAAEWGAVVEAQNLGLACALGGDKPARDISRILRLPGTMNIPDSGKIAKGRTARRASIIRQSGATYSLDAIASRYPPVAKVEQSDRSPEIDQLLKAIDIHYVSQASSERDLPADLRNRFESARLSNPALNELWQTGVSSGQDKSASSARFDLAKHLKAMKFNHDEFGALLWVWEHSTSSGKAQVNEWEDYDLQREIARCWIKSPEAPRHPDPNDYFDVIDDNPFTHQQTGANTTKLFSLVSFADAARSALAQSAKPLIKGFLDEGALSVLYGESNTGKSFLAMDIAYHIATGQKWANCRTTQSGVVYVAAEGGQGVLRRVLALQRHFATIAADSVPFHFLVSGVNLRSADADLTPLVETVRGCGGVGLVVLDTLSRVLAGGDENSSVDMGAFVRNVDHLRHATGAHTMLVHHSGKNRAKGARGHSLLRAATDTEIEIADNEITVTKQRDIDGNFRRSFVLDPLELGKDGDGDPITSCVVRLVSNADRPVAEPAEAEKEVLAVLRDLHATDVSASHFHEDVILDTLVKSGTALTKAALRSRLRTMEGKRLVRKPKAASYSLQRDNLSVEKSADQWFDAVDVDE